MWLGVYLLMTPDLKSLAKVGAQARLNELVAERDALLKMFPELKERGRRGRKPANTAPEPAAKPARKRKGMSAAARKAVGERMKAYWAAKRAEKAAAAAGEGETASGANGTMRKSGRKAGRKQGRKK
jgi:hypothetical protein